jgi:hypothetical protein
MTKCTPANDGPPSNTRKGVGTSAEVADYIGTTAAHLAGMRYKGVGPAYIRTPGGRTIRYRWEDVESWLNAGRVETDNSRRRA